MQLRSPLSSVTHNSTIGLRYSQFIAVHVESDVHILWMWMYANCYNSDSYYSG